MERYLTDCSQRGPRAGLPGALAGEEKRTSGTLGTKIIDWLVVDHGHIFGNGNEILPKILFKSSYELKVFQKKEIHLKSKLGKDEQIPPHRFGF